MHDFYNRMQRLYQCHYRGLYRHDRQPLHHGPRPGQDRPDSHHGVDNPEIEKYASNSENHLSDRTGRSCGNLPIVWKTAAGRRMA